MVASENDKAAAEVMAERCSAKYLAAHPCQHPDFLACNDPRWDDGSLKHAAPTVYVPNLVYMLHRLGGPENISEEPGASSYLNGGWRQSTVVEVFAYPRPSNGG